MYRVKLTLAYEEGVHKEIIQKSITIPIPADKVNRVLDFEGLLASKAAEFSMSIISSNVSVLTWRDSEEVPTEKIATTAGEVDTDLLVVTCPRLPDDNLNIMVFCPASMEKFVSSGQFSEMYKDIAEIYESMYWSTHDLDMVVYFKDGKTMRHKQED